jgi:hypothetical protein
MVLIEYLDPTAISTKLSFCRRFYRGWGCWRTIS